MTPLSKGICKNINLSEKMRGRKLFKIGPRYEYVKYTDNESRNTRNTNDSLGTGTKLLLPSLSLGFRHEERETQFFYVDCSSIVSFQLTDSTNARAPRSPQTHLPRPGPKNQLASSKSKSQLTAFIQNH